ncbi:hypothetical protein KPL70_025933 [Citrus sinensis]|nr:hypothetical protein KPL70_025933 [Citrus sinensis]
MAALHHQLVYRLQNHALDLPTPQTSSDALMIIADSETIHSIVQIPRQIQKNELLKLMPLEWLSNNEKFHQNSQPVQTSDALFEKRADGTVRMTFQPPTEQTPPRASFSYSSIITVVLTAQENIPIHGFASDGYLIYLDKINGYFLWDVPGSHMCDPGYPCLEEDDDDDFNKRPRRQKKKSHKMEPCRKRPPLPPDDLDNTTPFPIYKKGLRLIQNDSYQEQFPPLEKHTDPQTKVVTKPFILSPVTPTGQLEDPRPFKAVLNWQTQNARAQNSAFKTLDDKIERVATQVKQTDTKVDKITAQLEHIYLNLQNQVSQLDTKLQMMIQNRTGATSQTILKEFGSRFTGQYRQLQLVQAEIPQVLGIIYEQFLGEATAANEQTRREFHQMKCCSLQKNVYDVLQA